MQGKVEVKDVCYGIKDGSNSRTILSNVSFGCDRGVTMISGPSGSGKTTLLYAIAGLLGTLNQGEVYINNYALYRMKSKERDSYRLKNISMIFQNLNLFSFMNVEQNILVSFLAQREKITKETSDKVSSYLELLGLGQIQKSYLNSLSGGEQQRVAIIRSIISQPTVLLCDEPIACLDRKNGELFLEQLRKLVLETGMTTIIVSHDDIVRSYADSVIRIIDGKVIA